MRRRIPTLLVTLALTGAAVGGGAAIASAAGSSTSTGTTGATGSQGSTTQAPGHPPAAPGGSSATRSSHHCPNM